MQLFFQGNIKNALGLRLYFKLIMKIYTGVVQPSVGSYGGGPALSTLQLQYILSIQVYG